MMENQQITYRETENESKSGELTIDENTHSHVENIELAKPVYGIERNAQIADDVLHDGGDNVHHSVSSNRCLIC